MIFIAFVSVYLTVRTRFFQVVKFGFILRNTFGRMFDRRGDQDKERMTPFQATSTSLAGTVGMATWRGSQQPCQSVVPAQFSGCGFLLSSA